MDFTLRHQLVPFITLFFLFSCGHQTYKESRKHDEELYCTQGWDYLKTGQLENAEYYFNKALEKDTTCVPALSGLARIHLMNHNLKLSEFLNKKALRNDENWLPAKLSIAEIYFIKEEYQKAIGLLTAIIPEIKKHATNHNLYLNADYSWWILAQSLSQVGNYHAAISACDSALNYKPETEDYLRLKNQLTVLCKISFRDDPILKEITKTKQITRAQFAYLIVRIVESEDTSNNRITLELPPDVALRSPFLESIHIMLSSHIILSFPDGLFRPEHLVHRAEYAIILEKLKSRLYEGSSTSDNFKNEPLSRDVKSYMHFYPAVQWTLRKEFMSLNSEKNFLPDNPVNGMDAIYGVISFAGYYGCLRQK